MEACRKLCGGHGFLVAAGFAELQTSFLPFSTLEGTSQVLLQQTGRHLLRTLTTSTPAAANVDYLRAQRDASAIVSDVHAALHASVIGDDLASALLSAFEARSRVFCLGVVAKLSAMAGRGVAEEEALVALGAELCEVAEFHCQVLIASNFYLAVRALRREADPLSDSETACMGKLLLVHLLAIAVDAMGTFLVAGVLSIALYDPLVALRSSLCEELRRDALNLIEGYRFSDTRLGSVLGGADGNVYDAIVESTKLEPLNCGEARAGLDCLKAMINRPRRKSRL